MRVAERADAATRQATEWHDGQLQRCWGDAFGGHWHTTLATWTGRGDFGPKALIRPIPDARCRWAVCLRKRPAGACALQRRPRLASGCQTSGTRPHRALAGLPGWRAGRAGGQRNWVVAARTGTSTSDVVCCPHRCAPAGDMKLQLQLQRTFHTATQPDQRLMLRCSQLVRLRSLDAASHWTRPCRVSCFDRARSAGEQRRGTRARGQA